MKNKHIMLIMGLLFLVILISQNIFLSSKQNNQNVIKEDYDYVTKNVLEKVFKEGTVLDIKKVINMAVKEGSENEVLYILNDIWLENIEKHPDYLWDKLKLPILKIEIADVLLQSYVNQKIDIDDEAIHSYVVDMVSNSDPELVTYAIHALLIPNDAQDVEVILNAAQSKNSNIFKSSVYTLSYMCNLSASEALQELIAIVGDEDKKYVEESIEEANAYKLRSGWCDNRKQ